LAKLPNPINTRWRMIYPPNQTLIAVPVHRLPHGRVGSKQSIIEITAATKQRASVARSFCEPANAARRQTLTSNDLWRTATAGSLVLLHRRRTGPRTAAFFISTHNDTPNRNSHRRAPGRQQLALPIVDRRVLKRCGPEALLPDARANFPARPPTIVSAPWPRQSDPRRQCCAPRAAGLLPSTSGELRGRPVA
jgi:hypothetical protein